MISHSMIINRRNKYEKNGNGVHNFVTREEFMECTGIFITPDYFHNVCNEWQDEASKAGMTMDDFIDNYEENHIGLVEDISLTGTFKYFVMDDSVSSVNNEEISVPTIWDIVNSLVCDLSFEHDSKRKISSNILEIIDDMSSTLAEICELLEDMKDKVGMTTKEGTEDFFRKKFLSTI